MEALGLAGDITVYGERNNVVVISEEEFGVKKFSRVDLTSNEIFNSPNYYLKPNDIVYVEANKKKVASTSMTPQWFAVILSGLSLMVISISTFVN